MQFMSPLYARKFTQIPVLWEAESLSCDNVSLWVALNCVWDGQLSFCFVLPFNVVELPSLH